MDVFQAAEIIRAEEERFIVTLERVERKYRLLANRAKEEMRVLSGEEAFLLTATHGLPRDLLEDLASVDGLSVDWQRYDELLEEHRQKSRAKPMGLGRE